MSCKQISPFPKIMSLFLTQIHKILIKECSNKNKHDGLYILKPIHLHKFVRFCNKSGLDYNLTFSCFSHVTGTSGWLPPQSSWDGGGTGLPFGWEAATDKEGRVYYVK